jgi:hypothetical protein
MTAQQYEKAGAAQIPSLPFKLAAVDDSPDAKAGLGGLGELPPLGRDGNWTETSPPHAHQP